MSDGESRSTDHSATPRSPTGEQSGATASSDAGPNPGTDSGRRWRPSWAHSRGTLLAVIAIVVALAVLATGSAVPGAAAAVDIAGDVGGSVASAAPVPVLDGDAATEGGGDQPAAPSDGGTVVNATRFASGPDSDGDGLSDHAERRFGTNASRVDTDGDGLSDTAELRCRETLPGADPLSNDIYVELDSAAGVTVNATTIARLERAFADAPVTNPDGTRGIDLHVIRDDTALATNGTVYSGRHPGPRNDLVDFRRSAFDHRRDGHYYVLATGDVAYRGDTYYAGTGRPGIAAIETFRAERLTASLLMHELGHSFGLSASRDGVDEKTYSVGEYRSVMNYNALYEVLTYSQGYGEVGRDEWAFVAEERHVPELTCSG